jgi:endo-1,4-beta-xylanase
VSRWTRRAVMQAGLAGAGFAAGPLPVFAAERAADSLEALAHAKGMHFGTALSGRGLKDPAYLELVRAQCGLIVPESELKMPVIQPQPGQFQFERADALLDFAAGNDLVTRGHCLLWHHPRWLPKWLEGYDFGAEPAKSAEALLTDHITRTTTRYQKRIRSWDVVNEAVDNITGVMRETPLSKAIGSPDKVLEIAFRSARASLPDAELVYNDYMGWESSNAPHRDDIAARDKAVAALGRGFLDLTLSFTQVNAVLCWGLADSYTWLQRRNPRADGLPKRPTPYDVALQPKPLRKAMAAAFRAAPPRRPAAIAGIPA